MCSIKITLNTLQKKIIYCKSYCIHLSIFFVGLTEKKRKYNVTPYWA